MTVATTASAEGPRQGLGEGLSGLIGEVCRVAEKEAQRADRDAEFPVESLTALRRTGLLGAVVPEEYGGLGGTTADLVTVTMALGRTDTSLAMIFTMHCQQVAALVSYGSDRLRAEVLPAVARGDVYLASVTTEPGSRGNLFGSQSATVSGGGTLRIDRDAPIVTGGTHADGFLITTRAPDATSPAQVDLVYARRDQLRLDSLGAWEPLGMRATQSIPMRLAGSVPEWQVVGRSGDFRSIATSVFVPLAHMGWSAAWLGTATGAYSRVLRFIRSAAGRKHVNPASELLLHKLAVIRARLDVVHALLQHTVRTTEERDDLSVPSVQLLINTLKTTAADDCFAAVHELIELVGLSRGYLTDSPLALERAFRDLRSASLNYGNDRLRLTNGALALRDTEVRLA